MAVLAILTFLTVAFFWLRGRYLASPLGEFSSQARREHLLYASEFLQKKGYRIMKERIAHEVSTFYGSRKTTSYLVVDFLVEKDGVTYPAKVHSQRDPERISGAWLRRQFFALYTIYETPVVYVHPHAGTIELVDFSIDYSGKYYTRRWRMRLIWLFIGVVIGWLLSAPK